VITTVRIHLSIWRVGAVVTTGEIRATDLRFSPSEAGVFLTSPCSRQRGGYHCPQPAYRRLDHRSANGGALLQDETDRHAFVSAFSGDDRHIADYLMREVLLHPTVEFQDFLQQTSILDRLNASLCDAVPGAIGQRALLSLLDRTTSSRAAG